jgi:hypothetical protein
MHGARPDLPSSKSEFPKLPSIGQETQMKAWEFRIITPVNFFAALEAAASGDESACDTLEALGQAIKQVLEKSATSKPTLCLCLHCSQKFSPNNPPPAAFGVTVEMFPDRTKQRLLVGSAICASCMQRPDLMEAIKQSLHKVYGSDANFREIGLDA